MQGLKSEKSIFQNNTVAKILMRFIMRFIQGAWAATGYTEVFR